jgi:hypothetical protein
MVVPDACDVDVAFVWLKDDFGCLAVESFSYVSQLERLLKNR